MKIFFTSIWEVFILIYFIRNPCKKCLVKACCSEVCKEGKRYNRFCGIDGILHNRITVSVFYMMLIAMGYTMYMNQ